MLRPLLGCAALFLLAIARRRKRGALRGQSVLITGANSGIGRELALQAARLGVKELILVDLELMEDVVREARQRGGDALRISTHQTDVSNEEAVASLCAEIEVQVVLLSAGVVSGKAFLPCEAQQSPVASAEFRKTMDTNFFGSAWFAHQLLPSMLQRRCGAVVFLSSMMGFLGSARLSDYCASKWALLGLTESIRLELRAQQCTGVGVMAVCPYLVDTQMFNGAFEGADSATVFRQCVAWLRSLVFAKLSAKDVAAAILAELDDDLASLPPQLVLPWHAAWVPVLLRSLPASLQYLLLDLGGGCFGMEALLKRVQEADVAGQVALAQGPPAMPQPGANFRSWVEGLSSTHVVCTATDPDIRQAFAQELRMAAASTAATAATASTAGTAHTSRKRHFVLAACFACEGNVSLSAPTCAQDQVFHFADVQSKRCLLGMRFCRKDLREALQSLKADLEKPLLLYSEDSDAVFSSRLEFQEQLPRLNELLTAYYKMFQLDEELLVSVILAPLCHEATHAFSCTTTFQEICLLEDCNDRKDAAALQPPQAWPFLQDGLVGLRGPAGSLAFSLEAADALAEVLHRRAPISTYECFMQSLKSRSRSRQSPHARQPKADPHVAIDEEVELDFTEGGSVSSRVPKEAEQAGWLQDFLSDSPGVVKRRQQMLQALQAWEALSQNLTQEAFTALAEEKLDALTLTVRAEALLRLGRLEEAAKDCVQALRIFPESSMTTLVQAEVNLRLGYPADCLEDCNHLLDWNPRCSQASALRGEARLSLGHLDEAILDCDWALAHGHRSAAVLAVRGNAHRKLGNIREAISDADEALRECPSCCEALLLRGQAQLELREAGAALADLTKAIDIPHAASEVRVSALASRADAFVALQRYDKAITDCDEALTISRSPLALAIRGEAQLLSCEYQAALEDCSAALALEPTDPYTLAVRAEAHLCLGHRDDSIGDCDQALELSPGLEYAVVIRDRACEVSPKPIG